MPNAELLPLPGLGEASATPAAPRYVGSRRSSTDPFDFAPTPSWCLRWYLEHPDVEPLSGGVLEPTCGEGDLLASLLDYRPAGQLWGCELQPELAQTARARLPQLAGRIETGNVLELRRLPEGCGAVVANLPFKCLGPISRHLLRLLSAWPALPGRRGRLIQLVPLRALQPRKDWRPLFRSGRAGLGLHTVATLLKRPPFPGMDPGACAWVEHRPGYSGPARYITLEKPVRTLALPLGGAA